MFQNMLILICFFIGIILGISSFVRLLSWLFRKYNDLTVAVLIGFMAGALRKVWPWQVDGCGVMPEKFDRSVLLAAVLAAAGFILVLLIEHTAAKSDRKA